MQCNLVIPNAAASSSIEITEIDLGSALFVYNNVFIALLNYMQYILQNNLNLFSQWVNKWQLNISLSKCAVMTEGRLLHQNIL